MRLSLCIVGCGGYARDVLGTLSRMTDDFDLFFASRDLQKAREYCESFGGVDYFGSYEQAAADPRVQSMYFFTPHDLHLENARLAARNGKHVMMEKPIARTVAEATEMIEATEAAGVRLMVAENYRFIPAVSRCKELIGQNAIGDLRMVQIQDEGYSQTTGWRTDIEARGGGAFIDGGIHSVDLLVNIGGFPHSVSAARPPQAFSHLEGEDGLFVMCRLPGDGVGLVNYSEGTPITHRRRAVHVTGTDGELSFVPIDSDLTVETPQGRRSEIMPEAGATVRAMMTEFKSSVFDDREPLMSGREGLKDLVVVLGAYRSAREGREVALEMP